MSEYVPDSIGLQTVAYTGVASTAALLFDLEIRWIWGTRWGITRIAFVISRYLPFLGLAMTIYYTVESTRGGIPNHGRFSAVFDAIHILSIAAAEVLLVIRTYVFWGCGKKLLIAVSVLGTVILAIMLTIANMDASTSGGSTRGVLEEGRNASIIYGLFMIYELVLMSLTLYKRLKCHRMENSPVIATLYRDGVIYMLCITLASMANCIVIAVLPLSYTALLTGTQVVVHSVLASRILFNLRATNELQDIVINSSVGVAQSMAFQTPSCVDHFELQDIPKL